MVLKAEGWVHVVDVTILYWSLFLFSRWYRFCVCCIRCVRTRFVFAKQLFEQEKQALLGSCFMTKFGTNVESPCRISVLLPTNPYIVSSFQVVVS